MSRRSANEDAVLAKHGFTLGAELGEGTYSKVKHCTWQKPGESASKHIAIKGISKFTFKNNENVKYFALLSYYIFYSP